MNISIYTEKTDFSKEVVDVIRLFFENSNFSVNDAIENENISFVHNEFVENNIRHVHVKLSGDIFGESELLEQVVEDALENKRLHKRQVKRAVYYALKSATGKNMPWGSLTGVRPTRLLYAEMAKGSSMKEAVKHLGNVFDVSEQKLALLKEVAIAQQKLVFPTEDDVDIYVGIPYCTSRCRYCSFISSLVPSYEQMRSYVDALKKEIDAAIEIIIKNNMKVRALYMGGGTPTALPVDLLSALLQHLQPIIAISLEATVEAGRPDTIDAEKLFSIKEHKISRISINPQTMHDTTLAYIGRKHSREQCEHAYELAKNIGIHSINMDLIAGLPGESVTMFEQTLEWSKILCPESLTVHCLSIKRSSDTHLYQDTLPEKELANSMLDKAIQHATLQNYVPYYLYRQKNQAGNLENIGFAKKGHECLYNIDMMEENCKVIALGAGAISKNVHREQMRIERSPNIKQTKDYIEKIDDMIQRKYELFLR